MTRKTVKTLQVSGTRKRWIIAIGSHRNVIVLYNRYPLEGKLELSDFTVSDFERLAVFFGERRVNSKCISAHNKWTFEFDYHYSLKIRFSHHPFDGILEIGEISKDESESLLELFVKAKGA